MKLKIAFSTCPNDTLIFYALINRKIEECFFEFEEYLGDIEELNSLAFEKKVDIVKLSFNALGFLQQDYALLDSGSALGRGCGPILISKNFTSLEELSGKVVGIPGKYTTANFLFDFASDNIFVKKKFIKFDKIISEILLDKLDAGVIIHESRFTFKKFGLKAVMDLGDYWERKTSFPIPLGGIAVKKELGEENIKKIDFWLKKSILFGKKNLNLALPYIKKYAQEMEEQVIKSHIDLYVNHFTYSLGDEGKKAIQFFINVGFEKGIFSLNKLEII